MATAPGRPHEGTRTTPDGPRTTGEWKQSILRIYNRIKQDVAGTGVERQNIHITSTYIMIVAVNHRVPALATVTAQNAQLGRWADVALIDANKAGLARALSDELGVTTSGVFQDYDPQTQVAVTVALLTSPLPSTPESY